MRPPILRLAGVRVGSGAFILSGLAVAGVAPLRIGANVFINRDCYFDTADEILLLEGVRIADHVRLITSTHRTGSEEQRAGAGTSSPIVIGRGVWIGSGATILPGVRVADGCIIAAGAVVTASTMPNRLYGGVPAKQLRELTSADPTG
ncbi:MAG: acyltransferase [Glaciihabitans sp.]